MRQERPAGEGVMMSGGKFVRFTRIALPALVAGTLTGCGVFKPNASEGDTMAGVGVDGRVAEAVKPILDRIFDDTLITPQIEPRFMVRYTGEDSLGYVNHWQNVVLIGALDEDDPISQRVQRMLSEEQKQGVRDGELRVFRPKDLWARGQTVVVAVAPTLNELVQWLRENGVLIDDILTEDRYARMEKTIYSTLEQKELADSLRNAHGWSLRIPHDYALTSSSENPPFVRLHRPFPDRFITVAWEPGTPDSVTVDKLVRWRNRLGQTYPDSSRTNRAVLDTVWTVFGGVDALETHGLWETYGPLGGGPYVAWLLHKDGTLYLVDGKVFAPDREKEPAIRHLEAVLNTFQP